MSKRKMWKMLHMIYLYGKRKGDRRVLTERELIDVGVDCDTDSWYPLEESGAVVRKDDEYELSPSARRILEVCLVAKGPDSDEDIRVDYPEVFVMMPFSEAWSDRVYDDMLAPGIRDAGCTVERGDTVVRVGDLTTNIWKRIVKAGLIIAEVSVPNPNVFYEIGLADALGKDVFLFKQKGAALPADFGGAHYFEYDIDDLTVSRAQVCKAVTDWAQEEEHQAFNVKSLEPT